jgi:membrane dipeptidase
MVAWTIDVVGIDSVAIGTDYCPGHSRTVRTWWRYARWSRESAPAQEMVIAPHEGWSDWIKSPADLPNIGRGLEQRGLAAGDIAKIMGGNWLRLFAQTLEPDA